MAFRAYPSRTVSYACYDRSTPLKADRVEFDTTREYDAAEYCFMARSPGLMRFTFSVLFAAVPLYTYLTATLFIRRNGSATWEEIAGTDICVQDSDGTAQNQGVIVTRSIELQRGDCVQARPCFAGNNGNGLQLAPALAGNYATCNYFEGEEIDGRRLS